MTKVKTIVADKGSNYISDVIDKLPTKCLFFKQVTGCGGTTLEINTKRHSIISVPTATLATNKASQFGTKDSILKYKILAVHGKLNEHVDAVTKNDIIIYIDECKKNFKPIKIICTYDAVTTKVIPAIFEAGMNPYKDVFLLIDEMHTLLDSYVFRNDAVTNILNVFSSFSDYCFLTATPHEEQLLLEELKTVPNIFKIKFQDVENVTINSIVTGQVIACVVKMIKSQSNGNLVGNLHIFVNSVDIITKVISLCSKSNKIGRTNIDLNQIKVSCTENDKNRKKLGNREIINDYTDVRLVNFYTSRAFEGADIYDLNGKTVVVSDATRSNTLTDISIQMKQICGRLRNSGYNHTITHILNTDTRYFGIDGSPVSEKEFEDFVIDHIETSKGYCELLSGKTNTSKKAVERVRKKENKDELMGMYIKKISNEKYEFDPNFVLIDKAKFKRATTYTDFAIIKRAYIDNNFCNGRNDFITTDSISDVLISNKDAKISFESIYKEYDELRGLLESGVTGGNINERINTLSSIMPIVVSAYELIGTPIIKKMKYKVSNVKRKLKTIPSSACIGIVIDRFNYLINTGNGMDYMKSKVKIIDEIKRIYRSNNVKGKVNLNILDNYFKVKTMQKITKNKDGITEDKAKRVMYVRISRIA